ncbi:TonB-dependent siderophore receptor [bacterium]|nr:TonB-dependent siderophore receptor [bacterium]
MKKIFILLLILTISLPLLAQEQETEEKEQEETQDYYLVVEDEAIDSNSTLTPTKLPVSLQWTPASVGVVNRTLLETQAATYLGDALRNISGINVQSGFGTFDLFFVRGLDSLSNGLVLTDGAAEPETTYYQLYNVDRVEVLKGPGAFLYGGNPLSGTIHLVRKQPIFQNAFSVQNSYGSFESYRGTIDWNISNSNKDVAFRVNGLWENANNYRDDKDNDLVAVNPAFTWRINNRSFLNVNFEYVANEFAPDAGLPIVQNSLPDVPRTRSYQSPFDHSQQDIFRTRFDYETHLTDNITLRNKFYYTDLEWVSNGTLFFGSIPAGPDFFLIRTQTQLDDRQKLVGNQIETTFAFQTGDIKHKLLTGFELSRLGDVFTLDVGFLPAIAVLNPVETATPNPPLIPGASLAGDTRSLVAAPYFVDQIALTDKLQLFVGGRFDILDYDDEITSTSRNEKQFSPLFGVTYGPRQDLSVYFNVGQAFAPPSTLVAGERKPEEVTQVEAGVKKSWMNGKIRSSFAFYNLDKQNIAIPDDNGFTQQAGDLRSRGIEFDLSGSPAKNWETYFSYAFNDSELTNFNELIVISQFPPNFIVLDRTGNKAAFAPEHILNLWVLHDVTDRIKIGGGPRYVSSQFIAEDNVFQIDGYVTLDAYAAYQMDNWRISANFKNLTDKDYETRGFGSTSVIPADPFSVYFGVDFRL